MKYFDKNKKKASFVLCQKNREGGSLHSFSLDFDKPKSFTAIKKKLQNALMNMKFPEVLKKRKRYLSVLPINQPKDIYRFDDMI